MLSGRVPSRQLFLRPPLGDAHRGPAVLHHQWLPVFFLVVHSNRFEPHRQKPQLPRVGPRACSFLCSLSEQVLSACCIPHPMLVAGRWTGGLTTGLWNVLDAGRGTQCRDPMGWTGAGGMRERLTRAAGPEVGAVQVAGGGHVGAGGVCSGAWPGLEQGPGATGASAAVKTPVAGIPGPTPSQDPASVKWASWDPQVTPREH